MIMYPQIGCTYSLSPFDEFPLHHVVTTCSGLVVFLNLLVFFFRLMFKKALGENQALSFLKR